ncbi:uncharacterized protein LOC111054956 [Nilaparvata lugens]|uniref:uncharacterized protein LOC111054956 n=1 Tax=Nilaparvata lugens TaxID=108931 RepID=UPI00193CD014|nr:uncharacterized protein LOC111054956 [Nilaparvata lugens]
MLVFKMEDGKNVESVLNYFSLLREGTEQSQIQASLAILVHLVHKQQAEDTDDSCHELHLGIRRIIRGLGSPRSRARKGYYTAFIGLISTFPNISFQAINDAIEAEFSNYHPDEESDVFKGIILAYGAIISTGVFLKASNEQIIAIVTKLISISQKKSYFLLAVTVYLGLLLTNIDLEKFEIVWKLIHEKFMIKKKSLFLEAYYLLMLAQAEFPSVINSNYLEKTIGASEIFSKTALDIIAEQCVCIPHESYIESPMYQYIFSNLLSSKSFVKKVWNKLDEQLSAPTPLRMTLAFEIFKIMANKLGKKDFLVHAFTPNFVYLLENELEEHENIRLARRVAIDTFCKILFADKSIKSKNLLLIIESLYFYPGNFQMFSGLGTKLFQSLIHGLKEEHVKTVAEMFHNVLTDKSMKVIEKRGDEEIKRPWKESQKKVSILMLSKLLNHPSIVGWANWKVNQLKIVIDIGFFRNGLSQKLTSTARKTIYLALDQKCQRLTDLRTILSDLAGYFNEKLCSSNFISVEFSKETRKLWTDMMRIISSLENNATDAGKLASTTFHVMFLQFGLSLFKDPKIGAENLKELKSIYEHASRKAEDNDQLRWTDVIIDLILSLLSQGDKSNRHIITKVFIHLCPYLTSENVHQMLAVLNPNSKNPLMVVNQEADSDEEYDGDEDKESTEEKDETSGDESPSDESDVDMSGDDIEDDTNYDKLRAELRTALGNDATLTDTESVDLDDMNEDEGKHLDEKLSEAFRFVKQQQQKRVALEEKDLFVFRLKVLDLIKVWTKTEPELSILLDVISVVLMLLETTIKGNADAELVAKLKAFIKTVTSVKKYKLTEKLDESLLVQLVETITSRDDKTHSVYISMSSEIIECCTFIFKVTLRENMEETHEKLVAVYRNLLTECFLTSNSIVPIGLFHSILSLTWNDSITLVEDITSIAFNDKLRPFQRCQTLKLLEAYFRNKRQLTEQYMTSNKKKLRKITNEIINNGLSELENNYSDKLYFKFVQTKSAIKKCVVSKIEWASVESDLQQMWQKKGKSSSKSTSQPPNKKRKTEDRSEPMETDNESDKDEERTSKGNTTSNGQMKKKKKKRNNRILTKKERKLRRAKESSKGMDKVFNFSAFSNKLVKS